MSKVFVCDVCGTPSDIEEPHIEMAIQEGFFSVDHDVQPGIYDVCSVNCLRTFLNSVDDSGEDFSQVEKVLHEMAEEQVGQYEPTPPREEPEQGVGVYFPPGMRVDGKPADQLPRIRRTT